MAKDTTEMTHDEWLLERTKSIGGSDAATVLGLNKWESPFELFLEKTGQSDSDSAGEAAYFGNMLEDLVAKEFERRSGKKVRRNNFMMQHPDYPFITANIDRKVVGESAVLECKTASAFLAKDWEGDEIPQSYLVQVQHYLGVTGYNHAYIAVLIGGQKFIWKEVKRDEELIQMIFDEEARFWQEHVLKGAPPALDGSSAAEQFLKERYSDTEEGKTVDLAFEYKEKIDQLLEIKQDIKSLNNQKKEIENKIKYQLQDAEHGFIQNYQVDWKPVQKKQVDSKRLKQEKPQLFDEYSQVINERRMNIKELS